MAANFFGKLRRAVEDPSQISPSLRLYYDLIRNRYRIVDQYDEPGEPRFNALFLTIPVFRSFLPDSAHATRTNEWVHAKEIPRILNRLGFAVDIYSAREVPRRSVLDGRVSADPADVSKYDLVLGGGQKFVEYANRSDEKTSFIFLPGSEHWRSRVPSFLGRIDDLQRRKRVSYEDYRGGVVGVNACPVVADGILARADDRGRRQWAAEFPETPVRKSRIAHPPSDPFDVSSRNYETARDCFVCYAGNGPVLKGIDVALEAFADLDNLELYVVGPQNKASYGQFSALYDDELNHTDNIHNLGWIEMFSEKYYDVCRRCAYALYPSSTDGYPGAVVSMMWHGLVPIVSKEAIADLGEYGIQLPDCDIETVQETVLSASERSPANLQSFADRVYRRAREHHARDTASEVIESQLASLLEEIGFYEDRKPFNRNVTEPSR